MRTRLAACAVALTMALGTVASLPSVAGATNIGNEGCTPGYWKNHTESWEEYSPTLKLKFVFAFPAGLAAMGEDTMLTALSYQGGPGVAGAAQILLRASTAAFLNAAHEGLGYPYRRFTEPGNMKAAVDAALASGNRQQMIDLAALLDAANNLGCPLS